MYRCEGEGVGPMMPPQAMIFDLGGTLVDMPIGEEGMKIAFFP
jgi:FMN phosphatase YigB (HAD superfamily)